MVKKIQGEEIYLAPVMEEDIESFVAFMNDLEMTLFTGTFSGVYGFEEERDYFKPSHDKVQLVIHRQGTGKTLGLVELMNLSHVNGSAEIGISLGLREFRDKGYGREALTLMIEFAFLGLNLSSLYLTCLDNNKRGLALYKSLGFKEAGRLRKHRYLGGQYRDLLYMDLLKEEFEPGQLKKQIDSFME